MRFLWRCGIYTNLSRRSVNIWSFRHQNLGGEGAEMSRQSDKLVPLAPYFCWLSLPAATLEAVGLGEVNTQLGRVAASCNRSVCEAGYCG